MIETCAYDPMLPQFTGKERDSESGPDYFGARYFSPSLGRWLSPDWSAIPAPVPYATLTNPQSLNLYGYVGNNPETFADVEGHLWPIGVQDPAIGHVVTDEEAMNEVCGRSPGACTEDTPEQQQLQQQMQGQAQKAQEKKDDKPNESGVKAPPPGKPNVPPPPGKGPNGEPNEWEKIPGTDGDKYGPQYKPKFPVPGLPGGSQPKLWWDSPDGQWSHEPATGEPRGHFDWRGNKINSQAVAKAATAVGTAVVLYKVVRVLIFLAEAAAAL